MNPSRKNLLVFGYGLAAILVFVAVRISFKHGFRLSAAVLLILAATILMLTIFKMEWLKIVYVYWMKVAHVIGGVVTTLLLSVIFYLIFGVTGIILRLLKKDPLDQTIEKEKDSYWIKRETSEFSKQRYRQQF